MKFRDLSELKAVRGKFRDTPESLPPKPSRPSKSTDKKSPERKENVQAEFTKGQKVMMMDSNDIATIVSVDKASCLLEMDGLEFEVGYGEFLPINYEEDIALRKSVASKTVTATRTAARHKVSGELTIDLHLEKIPGGRGVPERNALDYQLEYFRKVLRSNLKHRGKRIVFVHGVGDGILAGAIRKELDEVFAASCSYTYNNPSATTVIIR